MNFNVLTATLCSSNRDVISGGKWLLGGCVGSLCNFLQLPETLQLTQKVVSLYFYC